MTVDKDLGQCVRNVLIRHEYHPPATSPAGAGGDSGLAYAGCCCAAHDCTLAESGGGRARTVGSCVRWTRAAAGRVRRVVCAGTRAPEMAVRLKYAGIEPERIEVRLAQPARTGRNAAPRSRRRSPSSAAPACRSRRA